MNQPLPRGLYAITDPELLPPDRLLPGVTAALVGGAAMVQYRNKWAPRAQRCREAEALAELCAAYHVPLIVNDDPHLAHQVGADGVHLGADDPPLETARAELGPAAIIGVSCYGDLHRARAAAENGADYVAFGSFFTSTIKPQAVQPPLALLGSARRELSPTVVAIGGISAENGASLVTAGADLLAVISALFGARDITAAARELSALFP